MDQDDFNQFEQATHSPQTQLTPIQSTTSETHTSPHTAHNTLPTIPQQPSILPSFSILTNNQSQAILDLDFKEWPQSSQPNLGKTESEHGTNIEAMTFQFGKRNSERKAVNEVIEGTECLEETGQASNIISNEATINTQQPINIDFGQIGSQRLQTGSCHPYFVSQDASSPSLEKKLKTNINEPKDQPEIWEDGKEELRKESQQFGDFGQAQQLETTPHQQIVSTHQFEVNQTIQTGNPKEVKEQIVYQQSNKFPQDQSIPPPQNQQTYQQSQVITQIQPSVVQDDDEDQFGDFEQTVQAPIEPQQQVQLNGLNEEVKIDETRVPYGIEKCSKEKVLQQFVDGLPDYSFLLGKGFNSL